MKGSINQPSQIRGKGGRPKRTFTDEIVQKIEEFARLNCHMDTIALALDIPLSTLNRRFGGFIKKKRAEGRVILRDNQVKLSKTQAAMAIFLGKNELEQVDKSIIASEPQQRELDEAQKAEAKCIASIRLHQGAEGEVKYCRKCHKEAGNCSCQQGVYSKEA